MTSDPFILENSFVPSIDPVKPSTAEDWLRSKAFPWGIPLTTSISVTFPSFFKAAKCARVPPIFPAPIKEILFTYYPFWIFHILFQLLL